MLIVAADRRELAGLERKLNGLAAVDWGLRWARQGRLGVRPVVIVANGAGRRNAARAVEIACGRCSVGAVVSTGLCGALDPALAVGQLVIADRVVSLDPPAEFPARWPGRTQAAGSPVLTVDRLVQTAEEKGRLRSTGAVVVEMEAAGVAVEAQRRGLPFFCVRVVSDGAGESFEIDYDRARLAGGGFSVPRLAAQAGVNPARWKELLGWRRRIERGATVLGDALGSLQFET
ncbi:MAG: hypothetical protein HY238_06245 [Acidobacteria bacterium]|nr:hypothetical protein [Acidobacteriota bacterium]